MPKKTRSPFNLGILKFALAAAFLGTFPTMAATPGDGEAKPTQKLYVMPESSATKAPNVFFYSDLDSGGGYLGVEVIRMTPALREHFGAPEDRGVLVGTTMEDSAARNAGLEVGDVLLEIDGQPAVDPGTVVRLLSPRKSGDAVNLSFIRDGVRMDVTAELGERPEPQALHFSNAPNWRFHFEGDEAELGKLKQHLAERNTPLEVVRIPNVDLHQKIETLERRLAELETLLHKAMSKEN